MKLALLCILALVAFAANSVLNRAALALDQIGPAAFLAIRLVSGAAMLAVLVWVRDPARLVPKNWRGPAALLAYMIGFSFAYLSLDTGTGALILFGGVQITMFAGALVTGERPGLARWAGSALAFAGLALLFLPGTAAPSVSGAGLMCIAAIGWGIYSLEGKGVANPLATTSANFVWAAPIGVAVWALAPSVITPLPSGIVLAIASGAITSGVGYAIWYAVLPRIDATLAAVAQLTVPIIALGGGVLFLSEPLTWRFVVAAGLVSAGVLLALRKPA